MRKILLLALLALPLVAVADACGPEIGTLAPNVNVVHSQSITYKLDRHGPLWSDTPNTVAHVYFDATGIHDTRGNVWTMVGTVPNNSTSGAFYPNGIATGAPMWGGGPFSAANYYKSVATPGPFAFPGGQFTLCVRFTHLDSGAVQHWAGSSNWALNTYGSYQESDYVQGGVNKGVWNGGGSGYLFQIGPHVGCAAFRNNVDGTGSMLFQQDLYPLLTFTNAGPWTAATTGNSWVGNAPLSTTKPMLGLIHEVWATTDALTEAQMKAMSKQAFGMLWPDGTEITSSDVGDAAGAYVWRQAPKPGGGAWNYSPFVMRIGYESPTKYGAMSERARYHYLKNTTTHPKAAEVTWALPAGYYTMASAGSGTVTLATGGGATSPDIAANCTGIVTGMPCHFTVTVAGTITVTTTSGVTLTDIVEGVEVPPFIASYGVSGTYIKTGGDALSLTLPAASSLVVQNSLQLRFTAAPIGSAPWSQSSAPTLLSMGASGTAGSARFLIPIDGKLDFDAFDAGFYRQKRISATHGFADGSTHTLSATVHRGDASLAADGVQIGSVRGSGTLGLSSQATLYFGSDSASNMTPITQTRDMTWSGYIRDVTISNVLSLADATPAADDGIVRIGAVSDTHFGGDNGYLRWARTQMDGWGPDVLVADGDLGWEPTNLGTLQWETNYLLSWYGGAPHVFAFGNHDIGTCGSSPCVSKEQQRQALPAEQMSWTSPGRTYGSTDLHGLHFIVVDSEYANMAGDPNAGNVGTAFVPTEELNWLAADIDAATLPVVIVTHKSFDPVTPAMSNPTDVQGILEPRHSKIALVLNGHAHCPANTTSAAGILYAGVGSVSQQLCNITTHNSGDHVQIEINPTARTVRVGWWENDTINGYLEVRVVSQTY